MKVKTTQFNRKKISWLLEQVIFDKNNLQMKIGNILTICKNGSSG